MKNKIIIVMPAYNASSTLKKTYRDIDKKIVSKIILVDDASKDDTVKIAKKLGITVYKHKINSGYGGNQKTCYNEALKLNPDCVVMLHPDYQYDSTKISQLVKPILDEQYDIMLGSRIRTRQEVLAGGMPLYKYIGNRFLTLFENIVLGLNLSEYHTGLRAYNKKVLKSLPWNNFSNDFVFDTEMLVSAVNSNFKIGEIPVPVRYFKEASSINFSRSVNYGLSTIAVLIKYILAKLKLASFPSSKMKNKFRFVIYFLLTAWFVISIFRLGFNYFRLPTEISEWIFLSQDQQREKIWGDYYTYIEFIQKQRLDANILIYYPDEKIHYLAKYYLYPTRVLTVYDVKALQYEARKYIYKYIATEGNKAAKIISDNKYKVMTSQKINNNIYIIYQKL